MLKAKKRITESKVLHGSSCGGTEDYFPLPKLSSWSLSSVVQSSSLSYSRELSPVGGLFRFRLRFFFCSCDVAPLSILCRRWSSRKSGVWITHALASCLSIASSPREPSVDTWKKVVIHDAAYTWWIIMPKCLNGKDTNLRFVLVKKSQFSGI